MMHLKEGASALLDNVWLWLADHDIDDPNWADDNNNMVMSPDPNSSSLLLSLSPNSLWFTSRPSNTSLLPSPSPDLSSFPPGPNQRERA
jgi:hypothetical protein